MATSGQLWMRDQVVYQVFPDRFRIGQGRTVRDKFAAGLYQEGDEPRDWDALPALPPRGRDFFGGDLWGVEEELEYIHGLGATCLYLTPIFAAPSNHKYDAVDFGTVDPAFGGDAAFEALAAGCRARGMRLVLDAVFNHVSDRHPWNRDPAKADRFLTINGVRQYWWGHRSLAELDLMHPEVRDHLLGPAGVVRTWLRRGADGWRLDTGQDLGPRFCRDVAAAARAEKADACVLPELMNFAAPWLRPGPDGAPGADGVMNYYVRDPLLEFVRGEAPGSALHHAFRHVWDGYGADACRASWLMLSSHDTPRLLTQMRGDRRLAMLAATLQFTLPGVPFVYYGEENGMEGGGDPRNRAPMVWDEKRWVRPIRERYRLLSSLRKERDELWRGAYVGLTDQIDAPGVFAFFRAGERPGSFALVAVNRDDEAVSVRLSVPYAHLYAGVELRDALGETPPVEGGPRVRLDLAPCSAAVYLPHEQRAPSFHYFKNRDEATIPGTSMA